MEHPNKLVDSFVGILDLSSEQSSSQSKEPLQANNVLLRGCVLRNTEWIIGMVVNTGHETKIMMSAVETKGKTSSLERFASLQIQRIIFLLATVCFVGTLGENIWGSTNHANSIWYLDWSSLQPGSYFIVEFFYFFLLHATFIPVSLYVSMSIVRFFQSYVMNMNLEMYYQPTDSPAIVRTMTLNEELGQITHVFSDKTGTLTRNVMDFRKASICGKSYGRGITEIGKSSWALQGKEIPADMLQGEAYAQKNSVPHVSFWCPDFEADISTNGTQAEKIHEFFRCVSICHDVVVERLDNKLKLSASNPDDEALVCAASYFGYKFTDRRETKCILEVRTAAATTRKFSGSARSGVQRVATATAAADTNDEWTREEVEILDTIEFTSKRKRMSVIIKETDGSIRLLCKGADVAIISRASQEQSAQTLLEKTVLDCNKYAVEGLRCLFIATVPLTANVYEAWKKLVFEYTNQ